jgi:DNA recombination protein RmuC
MMEIITIVVGIAVVVTLVFFLFKTGKVTKPVEKDEQVLVQENTELSGNLKIAEERIRNMAEQLNKYDSLLKEKETSILDLNRKISQVETENKGLFGKLYEQKEEVEKLQEKFRIEFKNLANEILEEKTKKFTEQNRTRLEEILTPLGDKIKLFEKRVEETYDKESKQRFSLEKEIKNLAELNIRISEEARNLTTALKSDTKKQGNWGELVLERVLESSGLVKGQEYIREFSTKNPQGDLYRPDVIVNLPDNKHIIIDSKVSLIAYTDYVNAETQEEKEKQLKLHLLSIRSHIKLLSEKNYQNLVAFDTPDYVLLFIPIESSFSIALQADIELFNFAWEKNVVIVSPTTLLATLRTISSIWKHEKQELNAKEIARQTGELFDKFVGFVTDLEELGTRIDNTKKSYDNSMSKLSTGKGNLIRKAEKIKELGAKASKSLPRNLLEQAGESDDTA